MNEKEESASKPQRSPVEILQMKIILIMICKVVSSPSFPLGCP